tara:strand:+ start:2670 stop:2888 length:219 start_codon:yes stop_codon:yes gene_type:complete
MNKMMIKITKSCKLGGVTDGAINPTFMTSALYVPEMELTAINMHDQPTIWVVESPDDIADMINAWEMEMIDG